MTPLHEVKKPSYQGVVWTVNLEPTPETTRFEGASFHPKRGVLDRLGLNLELRIGEGPCEEYPGRDSNPQSSCEQRVLSALTLPSLSTRARAEC